MKHFKSLWQIIISSTDSNNYSNFVLSLFPLTNFFPKGCNLSVDPFDSDTGRKNEKKFKNDKIIGIIALMLESSYDISLISPHNVFSHVKLILKAKSNDYLQLESKRFENFCENSEFLQFYFEFNFDNSMANWGWILINRGLFPVFDRTANIFVSKCICIHIFFI